MTDDYRIHEEPARITVTHWEEEIFRGTVAVGTKGWMKPLIENPNDVPGAYARFKSREDAEKAIEKLRLEH